MNGFKRLALLALCATVFTMNDATAEERLGTNREVIEIKMPKPAASLDLSRPDKDVETPKRHCLKNTGSRLRTKGTGRCAIGSGHIISGNEMQHRGWASISAGAKLKDSSGYW